jgi:hypothetical protein
MVFKNTAKIADLSWFREQTLEVMMILARSLKWAKDRKLVAQQIKEMGQISADYKKLIEELKNE